MMITLFNAARRIATGFARRVTTGSGLGSSVAWVGMLFGATLPVHAAVNLIDATYGVGAGSFEIGTFNPPTGPDYRRLAAGAPNIVGWSVGGPSGVDWLNQPNHRAADGSKSLDLKGTNGGAFGEISTSIPTVPGCTYVLRFKAYGGDLSPNSGVVLAGSLAATMFQPPGAADPSLATYVQYEFTFTTTTTTTAVIFRSLSSGGFGPVIDDVEVLASCATIVTQPHDVAACPDGAAVFTVTAAGTGSFTYQWRKGGVPITDQANHILGTTTATLVLVNLTPADMGSYDCVVSNACGSVTSDAAALSCAPMLMQPGSQPESHTVCCDLPAVFSVHPDCCADSATYQWQVFDGGSWSNMIDGDGASVPCGLVTGATTPRVSVAEGTCGPNGLYDDGRQFRCIVSNACGSVTSDPATLTVPCPADFNCDGFVTGEDFDGFVAAFEAGC